MDQTGTYVFEVEPSGAGESWAKESPFWTTANGSDTMFTLWNSGGSGEDLVATFTWNGVSGQYKLPVHLEAGASLVIDLAQLIAANRPDSDGNVIPVSAREGSAMFASTAGPHETINLVVSGGEYNVETATCCPPCICCYGVTAYVVSPSSATLPYGNTLQLSAAAYYNDGTSSNVTNYTTWSSGNTSVATVSSGGLVSGAGVGSTSVTGQYVGYGAPPPCSGGPCISQTFQSSSNVTVTPAVTIRCGPTDLAMGPTAPDATTNGTCGISANPVGGSCSWMVNKNTVTLSGANTCALGYASANPSSAEGDTIISLTCTVNRQSGSASSAAITTHMPTSLALLLDSTNPTGESCTVPCLSGSGTCTYTSYLRQRQYDVLDQLSPANRFSAIGLSSVAVTEGWSNPNVSAGSSDVTPFHDFFYLCATQCLPGGSGVTVQANQLIYANGPQVRAESATWTCTGVTLSP